MKGAFAYVVAFIVMLSTSVGVNGQQFEWWPDLPQLTETDRDLAKKTGRVDMAGKPAGAVLDWSNPKSGNSGTVELVENLEWEGRDCRRLIHEFHIAGAPTERVEFVTCLMADGAWKWPVPPKIL